MHLNDIINGYFELTGEVFTWRNAWQLFQDREIKGVYWPMTGGFAAWGLWNLYYYPSLGQWWSVAGAVVLVIGNIAWIIMAWRYTHPQSA